jgi:hypothetical protein
MPTAAETMNPTHALLLAIGGDAQSRLLLIGALFAVTTGIMLAIWLVIGKRQSRRHKHELHRWQLSAEAKHSDEHARKHKRRKERHRNPTLADTGGLPQRRPDDTSTGPDHPSVPH